MLSTFLLFKMLTLPLNLVGVFILLLICFFIGVIGGLSKTGSYYIAQNGLHQPHDSPASTFQMLEFQMYAMTPSPIQ